MANKDKNKKLIEDLKTFIESEKYTNKRRRFFKRNNLFHHGYISAMDNIECFISVYEAN